MEDSMRKSPTLSQNASRRCGERTEVGHATRELGRTCEWSAWTAGGCVRATNGNSKNLGLSCTPTILALTVVTRPEGRPEITVLDGHERDERP
ncbi:hypothetical protein CXB51_022415 [Gossypium anomalum]|uniref:Uncharacterized protein n=1 Tax=Gossypium anomalum TaxID=47600 RepID=A0A8J5Y5Y4_9ROSI|nr:hypothetical protein CXB51_022415 [Gossypium anomalum]